MDRRKVLVAMGSLACTSTGGISLTADSDAPFEALLRTYVVPHTDGVSRVNYAAWKGSPDHISGLDAYVQQLAARRPSTMSREEAFAFWCNLYNALTLKVILDRYPVASIRDIKSDGLLDPKAYFGPWRTKRVTVEARSYSLDEIENDALRRAFQDPRVHYALNCASIGCPNLRTKAWSASGLATSLDSAAREFINHPRAATLLPGNRLRVSSIYKWFASDFGDSDDAIVIHLRKYAAPKLAAALSTNPTINEDAYDWSLNGVVGHT